MFCFLFLPTVVHAGTEEYISYSNMKRLPDMQLIRKDAWGLSLQAKLPLGFLTETYCECFRLHSQVLPSFNLPPRLFWEGF